MVKKYLLLIGLTSICIGMNAMEPQKRFAPSYRQSLRPKPSFYTSYRPSLKERFQTWWQQPTQYELLLQAKEKQLRDHLKQIQSAYDKETKRKIELHKRYESKYPNHSSYSKIGLIPPINKLMRSYDDRISAIYEQEKQARQQLKNFLEQQKMRKSVPLYD